MKLHHPIVIAGGGAAGFFAAITAKQTNPSISVLLLEKSRQLLAKVRISGGGRCNVTHACFDPQKLVQYYPRGSLALRGPFSRFQPRDTVRWFEEHNVQLKKEADGRMFPVTDSSQTIIDCLMRTAQELGVEIWTEAGIDDIKKTEEGFLLQLSNQKAITCEKLILATGSSRPMFRLLETLGHHIQPPVASLFTLNIADFDLKEVAGISLPNVALHILASSLKEKGPLLITHWGFSGPAVLRLSAWGARFLHERDYQADVSINWISDLSQEELRKRLEESRTLYAKKLLVNSCPFKLPHNLWKALLLRYQLPAELKLADLSNKRISELAAKLHSDIFRIKGQTTYKEEFVTCGGVSLEEVAFKTMQSRLVPGLFFAGEILDIDGITGGFNFQNAWTTGWIAGQSAAGGT